MAAKRPACRNPCETRWRRRGRTRWYSPEAAWSRSRPTSRKRPLVSWS